MADNATMRDVRHEPRADEASSAPVWDRGLKPESRDEPTPTDD